MSKKKEALDNDQILAIIGSEMSAATGAADNDAIEANRKNALSTYLGDKGNTQEGRSSVVSTDVADAIEWIMPEIMKAFTQNNEVVTFDPVSANDRLQAELESRFVYDILMKDNEGFITIHEFAKDALMQKNGFLKAYYENNDEVTKEAYTGLNQLELEMLVQDPDIEVTGLTQEEIEGFPVFNVNLTRTRKNGQIKVFCVPPEDIRVNKMHNSVSLKNASFIAHSMLKTKSDLLEDGFDKEVIDLLPDSNDTSSHRDYRFAYQGESVSPASSNGDKSQTLYEVSECYLKIDIDGDGIAERCKITVAGFSNPTHVLEIEEVDQWPFISATAILMSHKLFGLSIYDRLKEIQAQKTSLLRNVLDNMYLQNNQRVIAVDGMVELDDLLISRPGGVIRAKNLNAVAPFTTPSISGDAYQMFNYLDGVRAGRTGVSPDGSISDTAMGDNVGSQGLERLLTQKEELVGLMIRVFAEVGIKPLCEMIRGLLIKHVDTTIDYEFHGDWVKVVPSKWKARTRTTVRVGTGSGNRKEQAAAISSILTLQEKIMANPNQALVTEKEVFAALNDFAKFNGMPGVSGYFLDPNSPEGQQNKQAIDQSAQQTQQKQMEDQQKELESMMKLANAEESKARAAEQNVQLQAQVQNLKQQLEFEKMSSNNQLALMKQELAETKELLNKQTKDAELEHKYYDTDARTQVELRRIDALNKNKEGKNEE